MDRLHSMRAFAKVIDEGGFAAAARAMDVSAAAVTRLVADLEKHLEVRLIHRSTRRLSLTPTGQGYLERVRSILKQLDEAEAQVDATVRKPAGTVKASVPAAAVARLLTARLPALQQQHPKLDVSLRVADSAADNEADIALVLGGHQAPASLEADTVARAVLRSQGVLCATPAYLKRAGTPLEPQDLQRHACLLASPEGTGTPQPWQLTSEHDRHARQQVAGNSSLSAQHPDTLYAAALGGLGIVGLPSLLLEDALAEGRLVPVLPEWVPPTFTLYAAMPSRKFVPARTRAVMEFLAHGLKTDA